jgi:hypothetical protein
MFFHCFIVDEGFRGGSDGVGGSVDDLTGDVVAFDCGNVRASMMEDVNLCENPDTALPLLECVLEAEGGG